MSLLDRLLHLAIGAVFICGLGLLGGCAHPSTPPPPESEPIGADALRPDSTTAALPNKQLPTVVVEPHRTVLDKVLGRTPAPVTYTGGTVKAGKKSTINNFYGTGGQSNTTTTAGKNAVAGTGATGGGKAAGPVAGTGADLTSIEKPKAPVSTGAGDATDNTKAGQRGGAAAIGAGATATATTVKPGFPWLKVVGGIAGAAGLYWVLFGGGGVVLLALWRRNKSEATNQV